MRDVTERMSGKESLLRMLSAIGFPSRYYEYCLRHPRSGGALPPSHVSVLKEVFKETGRGFRYDQREKFFAWRAASDLDGCELGVNVIVDRARVEWVLVFQTPSGHMGDSFAGLANDAMQMDNPAFQHDPPYPTPRASNRGELLNVLDEGLVLYDEIAAAIARQTWR